MASPLGPIPTVTTKDDGIYRDKGDGTEVRYYLFPEYEVHANQIAPGAVQGWHHHEQIIETLCVTTGSIEARWIQDGDVITRRIDRGDAIEVGASVHTFANPFDEPAEFVVFRFVPHGSNKRDLIRNDRHADPPPA